jgi:hypothetical protein
MNRHLTMFEVVSKEFVIHTIGEEELAYITQKVHLTKTAHHRDFIDPMGKNKTFHFVPMNSDVQYFIAEAEG